MKQLILFIMLSSISHASIQKNQKLLHPGLIPKLRKLEDLSGCKLVITSGHRSIEHNRAVGGAQNSYHLHGEALDLIKTSECRVTYLQLARMAQKLFNGVILYKGKGGHLHVDIRKKKYHRI